MPHFLSKKSLDSSNLDSASFIARGIKNNKHSLIFINGIFIEMIERKNDFLFKGLKQTRPTPIGPLKKELLKLANILNVKTHNLNNDKLKQTLESKFNLDTQGLLDLLDSSLLNKFSNIVLEIGFGSGRRILDSAKNNKDILHIGLEIHTPSLEQVLRQIMLLDLDNLYVLNTDARILLEVLPNHILDSILLHFPVPWNKAKHRRVISQTFFSNVFRVLKTDKEFELRSDDKEYFYDCLNLVLESKKAKFRVLKNENFGIVSKYQARWERQNKDIYQLNLTNLYKSEASKSIFSFNFPPKLIKSIMQATNLENLITKRLFKWGFVKVSEIYKANEHIVLIVSFGNFIWNLNLVVLLDSSLEARYLPNPPLNCEFSFKAHNELLNIMENL